MPGSPPTMQYLIPPISKHMSRMTADSRLAVQYSAQSTYTFRNQYAFLKADISGFKNIRPHYEYLLARRVLGFEHGIDRGDAQKSALTRKDLFHLMFEEKPARLQVDSALV